MPVGDAAVAAEREVDHVRRSEQETVRAAAVAVGDDRDQWRWRLREDAEQVGHGGGRHGRKVGGQHEQGGGAVLDRCGPGLREPVVQPSICLTDDACPGRVCEQCHLVIGRHHDRLGDPGRPEGGGEGALQEADHQVAAFLGVEHLAEPRLCALQVPDRDDARRRRSVTPPPRTRGLRRQGGHAPRRRS